MIKIRIDVTKITRERLFLGKNGAKYLNAILIERKTPDQWGSTHSIKEDQSKEEREAGKEAKFIGDARDWSMTQRPDGNREDRRESQTRVEDDDFTAF